MDTNINNMAMVNPSNLMSPPSIPSIASILGPILLSVNSEIEEAGSPLMEENESIAGANTNGRKLSREPVIKLMITTKK